VVKCGDAKSEVGKWAKMIGNLHTMELLPAVVFSFSKKKYVLCDWQGCGWDHVGPFTIAAEAGATCVSPFRWGPGASLNGGGCLGSPRQRTTCPPRCHAQNHVAMGSLSPWAVCVRNRGWVSLGGSTQHRLCISVRLRTLWSSLGAHVVVRLT
jgi:hypothetical protein